MFERLLAPLLEMLRPHFGLSKTRLETMAVMLVGLANCRTVNLSHLANQFPGDAKHRSNYRRLQYFFQFVQLDGNLAARLAIQMLNLNRPRLLALDRTNWKRGSRDVNILVLAIITRCFRVPLMWVLLDHAGNSPAAQRIELIERYLRLFRASSIHTLMADREFVGAEWMNFFEKKNVPFVIRLKEGMLIRLAGGISYTPRGTWEGWLTGMDVSPDNRLRCASRARSGSSHVLRSVFRMIDPKALDATFGRVLADVAALLNDGDVIAIDDIRTCS